ncbi:MAG: phytoene/squalene synthase family protein [Wenzhouxiangellaceae bacterium]|nr:phytoene/squalene synthase family protein [Wenzhouxiangellaceae bacterium]
MDHQQPETAAEILAQGSKSFAAATRLFGPALRRDVTLLYAWCRHCDDVTDGQSLGHGRLDTASHEALAALSRDSRAAARGAPRDALPYRALAEVCSRHAIPIEWIDDHLHGFALDVAGWQPQTLSDTLCYSYHVAGVVGMMMARIMGVHDTETLARASDLGLAFQLTNIARDVVEDAAGGRCYLPAEWLAANVLTVEQLADPMHHPALFGQVTRLLDTAEPYYASARIGLRALPPRAAWAVATALGVYRDIGRQLLRRGPDGLAARVVTPKSRKLWRMFTGTGALVARRRADSRRRSATLWTPPRLTTAVAEAISPAH